MKIQDILCEDVGLALAYRQLSPLQIGLLRKIAAGKFDLESASPQAHDAVEGLIGLGMVDDLATDATEKGLAALQLADKYGSTDRRNLLHAKEQNKPAQYVDFPEDEIENT